MKRTLPLIILLFVCLWQPSGAEDLTTFFDVTIPPDTMALEVAVTLIGTYILNDSLLTAFGYEQANEQMWTCAIGHQDVNGVITGYTLHVVPMLKYDVNLDYQINIADLTRMVNRLFLGGE